jgi:cephalosporin hydroxylase
MNFLEITNHLINIDKKLPADTYGLKWHPSLEPEVSNDADWFGVCDPIPPVHFSDLDHAALRYAYSKLTKAPQLIVEIGVDACDNTFEKTSTGTLLNIKPAECMYVGMDVNDKSHLNNFEKNIYTIRGDSANHPALYQLMEWHGKTEIDLLFIDGWHSVNQVLKEWKYWEKMIPNGVMAFHDINHHPGPVAVLNAIDTDMFTVEYFGRGVADWGVGVVQRKV